MMVNSRDALGWCSGQAHIKAVFEAEACEDKLCFFVEKNFGIRFENLRKKSKGYQWIKV